MWEGVLEAVRVTGSRTLILRTTFQDLRMSLIERFCRKVPGDLYTYNSTDHEAKFVNGSYLQFGYCASDADVLQYKSAEFDLILFDELTLFSLYQWTYMTSRNRSTIKGSVPRMAGGTNPGEIGHAWVKALWIDKKPAVGMEEHQYDPSEYDFIPAKVSDNPYLIENDPGYLDNLHKLPTAQRAALLEGRWDIFAGQYFDIFRIAEHTVSQEQFERQQRSWWPRWISMDIGYVHDTAVYWHAWDGERVWTYREMVVSKSSEGIIVKMIRELTPQDEKPSAFILSPDAWQRRMTDRTAGDEIGRLCASVGLPMAEKADTDRKGGARLIYEMLRKHTIIITDGCPRLIEEIPLLIHNPKMDGDVDPGTGQFDRYDAWRYGIKHSPRMGVSTPASELIRERAEPFAKAGDLQSAMMMNMISRARTASGKTMPGTINVRPAETYWDRRRRHGR